MDGGAPGPFQETWLEGEWGYVVPEGTSMAAPHVAAVAGLIMGYSDLEPADGVASAVVAAFVRPKGRRSPLGKQEQRAPECGG